jgi:hypothetical protein
MRHNGFDYGWNSGVHLAFFIAGMAIFNPFSDQSLVINCSDSPERYSTCSSFSFFDTSTISYQSSCIKGGVLLGLPQASILPHVTSTPTLRRAPSSYNCLARVSCLPLVVARHLSRSQGSILSLPPPSVYRN